MLFLDYTPDLTETDMIIYRVIVKNIQTVIYMRIRDLASTTYCSTASIQRFCQKFECSGWAEFKTRLRIYLDEQESSHDFSTDLDSGEVVRSVMENDTPESQKKINTVSEILLSHKQVVWFGCGTSRIMAEFGALTYSSLVNMSLAITDPLNNPIINFNSGIENDMCLIVCSVSGENRMVIKYVDDFIKHKIPVIAITNNGNSTIAKMCHNSLTYYATEQNVAGANITTQTPAMFLIEKLIRHTASLLSGNANEGNNQDNIR